MIYIDEDKIINEDFEIIDFNYLENITNSGIKKCVCKIELGQKKGTGFFCKVPPKNIKIFVTNNHVLNQDSLNIEKNLNIFIQDEKKVINLNKKRFILTEEDLDFTIIEILDEDNINNFLEIDEFINTKNYEGYQVFTMQHPKGEKLQYSHGKILKRNEKFFLYSLGTNRGSSGAPILLVENLKLIGLHKGEYKLEKNNEIVKLGIPINLIINKINKNLKINTNNNNNSANFNINNIQISKDILPRGNKSLVDKKIISKNNEFININFRASTGLNVLISASKKTTIKELIKMYLERIGLKEELKNLLLFTFDSKSIDTNSEETIERFKNLSIINVIDIGNVIGA